jgi:hypothetical protein
VVYRQIFVLKKHILQTFKDLLFVPIDSIVGTIGLSWVVVLFDDFGGSRRIGLTVVVVSEFCCDFSFLYFEACGLRIKY